MYFVDVNIRAIISNLLYYAVVTQNSCVITTGYIRLHVSAVIRPSSGQQGIVLIKVHSLVIRTQQDGFFKKIQSNFCFTLIS